MKHKPRGVRGWAYRSIQEEHEPWPTWVRVLIIIGVGLFILLKLAGLM